MTEELCANCGEDIVLHAASNLRCPRLYRRVEDAPPETPKLPGSFDACDWAAGFVAMVKWKSSIATDEDTMRTWFANAIMAGYDEAHRRLGAPQGGGAERESHPAKCRNCGARYEAKWIGTTCSQCDDRIVADVPTTAQEQK